MRPPVHIVPRTAPEHHGVARCARELAATVGAGVTEAATAGQRQHVHFTDRLFGASPEAAAAAVVGLCATAPTTLTLHDVPQPGDGAAFERRAAAYAAVVLAADGWVTSSHHEHDLVLTHTLRGARGPRSRVIPLAVTARTSGPMPADRSVAVLGWVYPGKGHREVIEASARLPEPVEVAALGAVTVGHEPVAAELVDLAARLGVPFRVTGALDDQALTAELHRAGAGVALHRNLSASGSVNSWVAAGRRPLVRDGAYAREMLALRPGTVRLVGDDGLVDALAAALADPASTMLGPDAVSAPHLAEVAASYLGWWGR